MFTTNAIGLSAKILGTGVAALSAGCFATVAGYEISDKLNFGSEEPWPIVAGCVAAVVTPVFIHSTFFKTLGAGLLTGVAVGLFVYQWDTSSQSKGEKVINGLVAAGVLGLGIPCMISAGYLGVKVGIKIVPPLLLNLIKLLELMRPTGHAYINGRVVPIWVH